MNTVWQWQQQAVLAATALPIAIRRYQLSPLGFCAVIHKATRLPGKPGILPPKQRAKYFHDVRHHADALIRLLSDTRFDVAWDYGSDLSDDDRERPLEDILFQWGDDDPGHIVAFYVSDGEKTQLPWDYPDSHLVGILHELIAWTDQDDCWDRDPTRSSTPITRSGERGIRVSYLTRTLHQKFQGWGISIPFALLATIANVALEIPAEESVDEDAVRKQVRRHERRQEADAKQRRDDRPPTEVDPITLPDWVP